MDALRESLEARKLEIEIGIKDMLEKAKDIDELALQGAEREKNAFYKGMFVQMLSERRYLETLLKINKEDKNAIVL